MAAQYDLEAELKQLKAKVQDNQIVVGKEQVLQLLKGKGVSKVFLAVNCPLQLREDVFYYAERMGVPVVELPQTNEELGIFCKKNFMVSVLGIRGE